MSAPHFRLVEGNLPCINPAKVKTGASIHSRKTVFQVQRLQPACRKVLGMHILIHIVSAACSADQGPTNLRKVTSPGMDC